MLKTLHFTIFMAIAIFVSFAQPGALDLTFTPGVGPSARVVDSKINSDNKLLIGGLMNEYQNYYSDAGLFSLESNADKNTLFYAGGVGAIFHEVFSINNLSNGDIIAGGSMYNYNSTSVNYGYLSRMSVSGSSNFTFNPALLLNGRVFSTAVQSDDKIIYSAFYNDPMNTTIPLYKFERLNSTNGSVDATFTVGSGPNDVVQSIAIQSDGKIIIGGRFTSYNGTAKNYIARINANGTIDNTFNVGTGFSNFAEAKKIIIQSDGKVLVAGNFTTYNGTARSGIVRINTNGSIDTSFDPGTGAQGISQTGVYDMALQSDGKIIIVGEFHTYNGTSINSIARINANGTLDATFNPGTGANNTIHTITIQADEKIIIGGDFTSYNGTARNRVARLLNCTPPTITGTTPSSRCGTGTVSIGATASAGTLNWYAASSGGASLGTGTSFVTPSISSNTTYYVETTNAGCTSTRTAVTASVNAIPTITGTTPNSRCGTGTVSIGATASAGTINWFANSSGGSSLGTGTTYTTPSISSNVTYYAEASNNACLSTRSAVTASINAIPTITGTAPNGRCGTGTVSIGATASAGTINWFANSSGGSSLGSGTNYITPSISSNVTYYAEASNNGCLSTRSAVTASVNAIPTITGTTPNSRCGTGTVSIGATASAGTINWFANSSGGSSLGTGTTYTTPSISSNLTYYAEASNNGCLSTRSVVTASVNAIPTITGTTPNSRCGTGTVSIGATASAGTINWFANSSGGSSLGTGTTFTSPSISSNTIYYAEASNNGCTSLRTSVTASVGSTPTITSVNSTSICGNGSATITASSSNGVINWFENSTGGSSIGTGNSFTTPSISSNTTYFAEGNDNGCLSVRASLEVTVSPTPIITSTTSNSRCGTGTVSIGATANSGTINWYTNSSGGSSLETGTTFTTPSISSNVTYYAEASNNGCTSTRTAVTASVNAIPTITGTTPNSRCGTGTVSIGATASAGTINWFANSSGGSSLGTGTTFTSPSISSNTTYYAEASENTCNSTRTAVTASINTIPNANVAQNGNVLSATESGMTYQWIDCSNSNTPISGQTSQSYTATTNGNYAVIVSNGICQATSVCTNVITTDVYTFNNVNSVSVFPNPSINDNVIVKSTLPITKIELIDLTGKTIQHSLILNEFEIKLNLNNLTNGIYFVKIYSDDSSAIHKLIIQK